MVERCAAITRNKSELEQELWGGLSSMRPTRPRRWQGLPLLSGVPSCGACTATVAGLKLVTPAIGPVSDIPCASPILPLSWWKLGQRSNLVCRGA